VSDLSHLTFMYRMLKFVIIGAFATDY
jgi:hypothetical protein